MENRVVLFKYKGYELLQGPSCYFCVVDFESVRFQNAGEWKKFIDKRLCQEKKDL